VTQGGVKDSIGFLDRQEPSPALGEAGEYAEHAGKPYTAGFGICFRKGPGAARVESAFVACIGVKTCYKKLETHG
jgi:hypothetical protein